MKDKKVVFMGTPSFAVPVLKKLIENCNVIGVVTQPDSYIGRKKVLTKCPVKEEAELNNIKVLQPEKLRNDYECITSLNPDIIITCAYGQILPEELLQYPEFKTINVHGSILPKLRGGAPIQRAIMEGMEETGITIIRTDKGMDSGDIITAKSIIIEDTDNYGTLSEKLSSLGANLLIETLPSIFNKTCKYIKQDENEVTFAKIIKTEDEHIDFNKLTKEIYNQVRALLPTPAGYSIFNNERVKIYEVEIGINKDSTPGKIIKIYSDGIGVSTSDGEIIIKKLQVPGKKIMNVRDYLNGINKDNLLGKRYE